MSKLEVYVAGEPVAKGRPRGVVGSSRHYTPKKTLNAEANISLIARAKATAQKWSVVKKPKGVEVEIMFIMKMPQKMTEKTHGWSRSKMVGQTCTKTPDIDNLTKTVLDGLNKANIWEDDSQVGSLKVLKIWGPVPGTLAKVSEL